MKRSRIALPDYESPDQHRDQNKQEADSDQHGRVKASAFLFVGVGRMFLLFVLALVFVMLVMLFVVVHYSNPSLMVPGLIVGGNC